MGALNTDSRADPDSDDDVYQENAQPASSLSERRRVQEAILDNWINSDAGQEAIHKTKDPKSTAADEEQSIHSLMKDQYTEKIKHPRDYQIELFERAKNENTIAVLDTGSGKTLISVLLLRWIIDQELENRARGHLPKISFFLTQSVTLAHQQFSVLKNNLDHRVARVCGSDNVDIWEKSRWLKLFTENKVIVCTADILSLCLSKSFITMKQINLLIFDEAHHAKKNHAYARILLDYYRAEGQNTRPRVFGMTASPIDAKADVASATKELEAILHSKIATTEDMSLTNAVKKPDEHILRYAALAKPLESRLFQLAKAHLGHINVFQRALNKWEIFARELGSWCADQYLVDKLSETRLRKHEIGVEQSFHKRSRGNDLQDLDTAIAQLRSAIDFIRAESKQLCPSGVDLSGLTDKVLQLRAYLGLQFERPTSQRCLVFVDRRDTARLLDMLFEKIGTSHMRCAHLIGGNNEKDEDNFSFRQQVMTLIKFRKGELNCLFATSVAEEGLDIPDCNLVIRFSMAQTMIQYVQSRGRARQQNSKFLHMVEYGNSIHAEQIREVRYQEIAMRELCKTLPDDRKLIGNGDSLEALMSKEKGLRIYTDPLTGAKLTYGNAMVCLASFVASIPSETDEPQHPTYVVGAQGSKFICEVLLPGNGVLPLRSATGRMCTKKTLAKRSAAFEACLTLKDSKLLDEHLLPVFHKKLPVMRNALLAVNSKKTNQYSVRDKPSVWQETQGKLPSEVWLTIVDFPQGLQRKHQPMVLVTRTRMPDFPDFPVFLDDSRETAVVSKRLQCSLVICEGDVASLSAFTFRIFKDVFSKTYEEEPEKLSYWLAPAAVSTFENFAGEVRDAIDWATIQEVVQNPEYSWTPGTSDEFLLNRFLVDRWDGSRKFYSVTINTDLRPLDSVPADAAKPKHKHEGNILGYSVSLFKKSRGRAVWEANQPVLVAELLLTRRNMLAAPGKKEVGLRTRAYLCPEPLKISTLPPAVAASCVVWPAIIHRFESYLIALEACSMIGIRCDTSLALAAMTKDSDNTGEHDSTERINFRHGMGENYERLEFIGDTFLKTATSISTFIQNPNDNEFDFHVKRMRLLCNKNLYNVAVELKLYEYIRSNAFTRRIWYPEGLNLLEGKGVGKDSGPSMHGLGDKTIADVSEALIGAAFVSHDKPDQTWHESQCEDAVRAVTKLTSLVTGADSDTPVHAMTKWNDYRNAYEKPEYQTGQVTASQRDLADKVALEHPYRFKYPRLLRAAFIHPSQPFMHEKLPNYQRLEFLGDALLDLACVTHMFYRYPEQDPQWLTEHKMAMVSNKFLGAVCVTIGFHKHLRHSSPILEHQITQYVTELTEAKRIADDSRDYWTNVSDPPKCLPDIVESFVGAMFIDSDFDYNVVQNFFNAHMKWYFEDMSIYDTFANNHPCTRLHNLMQTTFGCQDYRRMCKEIPSVDGTEVERKDVVAVVMVHNEIIAHSKGKSSRYAEVRAASKASEILESLAPFEFRSRFGCNCHLMHGGGATNGP